MHKHAHARQHTCTHTPNPQSGVHKWIMISVPTQRGFLKRAGLTTAKEAQPQTSGPSAVSTISTLLHLLPASDCALAFLITYLDRREATRSTSAGVHQ